MKTPKKTKPVPKAKATADASAPKTPVGQLAVVVNPTKFDDLDEVREEISGVADARGVGVRIVETTEDDPGFGQTRQAVAEGADVVVEAVGRPETWKQAFYARDLAGTVVLVGVPTPDKQVTLPMIEIFGRGGALKSSWYGDCLPSRDFPMLVDLYRQGRFPLESFVSERIGLGDVEAAFEKMHHGDVLRSVVVMGS